MMDTYQAFLDRKTRRRHRTKVIILQAGSAQHGKPQGYQGRDGSFTVMVRLSGLLGVPRVWYNAGMSVTLHNNDIQVFTASREHAPTCSVTDTRGAFSVFQGAAV